jgi:3-oxoacyl-[acyl-carrier-protein] synthase-3
VLKAKIIGTGSYLPEKRLTNEDLEKMVDTSDEWITERTGIKERRIASPDMAASDLAYEASKKAIQSAGITPQSLDLIIVATVSGDMPFPSTASILQNMLGCSTTPAFDINAACSGFIYGLSIAESFIKSGKYKRILLAGSEVLSKMTNWQDRTTCILFGDGAGAVVLEASKGSSGIMSTHIYADGSLGDLLGIPAGGSRNPVSEKTLKNKMHCIRMKGNETFKVAVRALESIVLETLKANNLEPSQLAALIPHQANLRIIQATAKRLGLSIDKVVINLERYGNTSAASVPIALDEAVRTGRINKGDYILLEAFGGGLTWGAALIKW